MGYYPYLVQQAGTVDQLRYHPVAFRVWSVCDIMQVDEHMLNPFLTSVDLLDHS